MDSGGDGGENHAQLLSKTSAHGSTATLVEETPLIDAQPIGQDDAPPPEPEIRAWDTSMLSEVNHDLVHIRIGVVIDSILTL